MRCNRPAVGGNRPVFSVPGLGRQAPEHVRNGTAQRRKIVDDNPPDDFGIDAPVLVPDQIAERPHIRLADCWLRRQNLLRNMVYPLRDDLQGPFDPEVKKSVSLKSRLTRSIDGVDRGQHHLKDDVDPARHQNTRTAPRSISPRSFGCRLSRVVTSTLRPIDSFNRRCRPARSSNEKRASGAISMKTSRSLSGLASPRAVDPNRYAASTLRARNASVLKAISAMAWSRIIDWFFIKLTGSGMMPELADRFARVGARTAQSLS